MSRKQKGKEVTDESEMIRSIILTIAFTVLLIAVGVLIWIRFFPFDLISTEEMGGFNSPIALIMLSLIFGLVYGGLLIITATLREYYRAVAGWFDVIVLAAFLNILVFLMFGSVIINGAVTGISVLFVLYLHRLQE